MLKTIFNTARLALLTSITFNISGGAGHSKPLLTNSQATYASACLEAYESPERLIEICQRGLGETGASDRQRIEMLDRLAWAQFDLGDYDQSDKAFSEILDIDPEAEPGLQGRAWILYQRDRYDEAADWFRKAVSRKPTAESLSGLAASSRRSGQVDFNEYEQLMRLALSMDPEYVWGIRELAWSLADYARYDEALSLFRSATDINPQDANSEYGIAYVLSEQDAWEEAFTHITRTLELSPDSISAKSRRSLILLMLDRPKQALKDAEAVVVAWPDNSDGYVRKARALSALDRRAEAHAVLEQAEETVGAESYLLFWRADLLVDDYEYEAALVQIRRSVQMEDANHFDHRLHAEIALWLNKTNEARGAINLAIEDNPNDPHISFVDALVMLSEGEYKPAELRFDEAIKVGLPEDYLPDFLEALVAEGRFMQAIAMRLRYGLSTQG
ncbi:tetratricopeptide repeat protein [Ruegeria sp. R13_0]|uniref:tetratricopeptide repeat protein n=1 Tax=Ruegeria sp. R13_0 TaxID=2821099 RepID=UPI001ADC58E8|nr:tetratricopeptide repeat protein [Ruegeria sp. R13_0]MBO9436818.1 tetratricopeptide repeat protein [Ruegeria sp. R13_0]